MTINHSKFYEAYSTNFEKINYIEARKLRALCLTALLLGVVKPFLDKIAAHGFNYVILNTYAHDTSWRAGKTGDDDYGPPPIYPWKGSNEQPDHSQLNVAYWQHYNSIIHELNERGLMAHIFLKVYNKKVKWPACGSA